MKRFILKTIKFVIPIVLLMLSVNYIGDAARLFSDDYEKKIVAILASGNFATNITNYDERIFQREITEGLNHKPAVLVLGSSRSMLIKQEFFPENVFMYNCSVSGASIEDLIAIYQMYKAKNRLSSKVIIGFDPWIFNKNNGQQRWKSITKEYHSFLKIKTEKQNPINKINFEKLKQLTSISYFQSSLKAIPDVIQGKSLPVSTNLEENETITILLDGSITYGSAYRTASIKEVKDKAISYKKNNPIYSLGAYTELSKEHIKLFMSMVEDMESQGIAIIFFLAPYHPIVYEEIKKNYPLVLESEEFLKNYAEQKSYPVIGSFNPNKISINENFFYDGMHLTEEGVKKICMPILNDLE